MGHCLKNPLCAWPQYEGSDIEHLSQEFVGKKTGITATVLEPCPRDATFAVYSGHQVGCGWVGENILAWAGQYSPKWHTMRGGWLLRRYGRLGYTSGLCGACRIGPGFLNEKLLTVLISLSRQE